MFKLHFSIFIVLFGCCIFTDPLSAMNTQTAQDIFKKAATFSLSASFKATKVNFNQQNRGEISFFSMVDGQGQRLERYECFFPERGIRVIVKNSKGTFLWTEKPSDRSVMGEIAAAIRGEYADFRGYIKTVSRSSRILGGEVTGTHSSYNGIPCYRIIVTFPSDDISLQKLSGLSPEQFVKQSELERERAVVKYIFWITKGEKPFIYAYSYYNMYGKERFSFDWGKVEFISLDPALFKVPDGLSVRKADTPEKLKKVAVEVVGKKEASAFSKILSAISSWCRHLAEWILESSGLLAILLQIVSAICIIGVILLKVRKRQA